MGVPQNINNNLPFQTTTSPHTQPPAANTPSKLDGSDAYPSAYQYMPFNAANSCGCGGDGGGASRMY